jgi:hypothetical protein
MSKRVNLTASCRRGIPPLVLFSRGGVSYGWNGWLLVRDKRRRNIPEVHNDSHLPNRSRRAI